MRDKTKAASSSVGPNALISSSGERGLTPLSNNALTVAGLNVSNRFNTANIFLGESLLSAANFPAIQSGTE